MLPIIQINVMTSLIRALFDIYFFWIIVQIRARAPGGWRRWVCQCWPSSARCPTPPRHTSPGLCWSWWWSGWIFQKDVPWRLTVADGAHLDVAGEVLENESVHCCSESFLPLNWKQRSIRFDINETSTDQYMMTIFTFLDNVDSFCLVVRAARKLIYPQGTKLM